MENDFEKNEKDYIKIYQDKGYVSNFYFKNKKLVQTETKNEYAPEDIKIVAEHRYEGISNPDDMSILYVLETNKGEKGTFLIAYGPQANFDESEFFRKIPKSKVSDKENIDLNNS